MLAIRFLRTGKRNQPSFSIVVTEKRRAPRSGRFIEKVGFYNPLTKERKVNAERIQYWLSVGAKPSDTVHNILVSEGIVEGKKIPVHKKSKAQPSQQKEEAVQKEEGKKAAPEEKKEDVPLQNEEEKSKTGAGNEERDQEPASP